MDWEKISAEELNTEDANNEINREVQSGEKDESQYEMMDGVSLGLEESDAADYDVNAANGTEETYGEDPAKDKRCRGRGRFAAVFAAGIVCGLIIILVGTQVFGIGRFISRNDYDYLSDLHDSYGKYYEIMQLIGEDPIAKSDPKTIGDEELKRIVSGIGDPYAEYFTADEYREFEKRYLSGYVGIGIGVVRDGDDVIVMRVFEDSPALEAGIKEGDIIREVDGKAVTDVDAAIDMISDEAGSKVNLTIERNGETLKIESYRDTIEQDSVTYKIYEGRPDVGYIFISTFREDTSKEFRLAVKDLKNKGCDKFIIDLRDNGGGLTDECLSIADYLLPACRLMSEVKKDGTETVHNSKPGSADIKYVVLVNENTASASEILAAAIQDNKGGTIIGKTTYGKGVTQITRKFSDGSAIKITSTEYFRPNGKSVNGIGVTPDIEAADEEAIDKALEELGK